MTTDPQPFALLITLAAPLVGDRLPTFDAILAGELALSLKDDAQALDRTRDLLRHTPCGVPYASSLLLREIATQTRHTATSLLSREWADTPPNMPGTPNKPAQRTYKVQNWQNAYTVRHAPHAVFIAQATGHEALAEIDAILESVAALGKRRAAGFGTIQHPVESVPLDIIETSETWGLTDAQGAPVRPLPLDLLSSLDLTLPPQAQRIESTRARPFYWSTITPSEICAVASSTAMDDFDLVLNRYARRSTAAGKETLDLTAVTGRISDPCTFFARYLGNALLSGGDTVIPTDPRAVTEQALSKYYENVDASRKSRRLNEGNMIVLTPKGAHVVTNSVFPKKAEARVLTRATKSSDNEADLMRRILMDEATSDVLIIRTANKGFDPDDLKLSLIGSDIVWVCTNGGPAEPVSRRQFVFLDRLRTRNPDDLKAAVKARKQLDRRLTNSAEARDIDAKLHDTAAILGVTFTEMLTGLPPVGSLSWKCQETLAKPKRG